MRTLNSALFKAVNQHAHLLSRSVYEETRNALRARALQLVKNGEPVEKVIDAIVKATIRQTLKP
ncbi:MAG: hypothetical protein WCK81_15060 [Betaproteobacteria bacterium]